MVRACSAITEGILCRCSVVAEVDGNKWQNDNGNDKNDSSQKISRKHDDLLQVGWDVKDQQEGRFRRVQPCSVRRTFKFGGLYVGGVSGTSNLALAS